MNASNNHVKTDTKGAATLFDTFRPGRHLVAEVNATYENGRSLRARRNERIR